ncbi:transmembrane protein, putative [Medicago truncatula]|uniref:Transmembrane protein, putative n=1 Tax=Medicago truncatula TaxID=3880 RepID=G7JJP5_MEDTR|nr:transmembrane protein, putative [Medicago truncatula]
MFLVFVGGVFVFVIDVLLDALLPLCYRLCVVARRNGMILLNPRGFVCYCRCGSIYGVAVVVKVDFVVAMVVVVAKVDLINVTSIVVVVVVAKVVVVFSI